MKKISILVANNCFMDCAGCYLDRKKGNMLSAEEILSFGEHLVANGYEGVTVSGGDPLTRSDILEIVLGLNSLGLSVYLDTVGKPILEPSGEIFFPLPKMSNAIDLIGIPLDGSNNDIINLFRTDAQNMLEQSLGILEKLDKNSFNISVNTVVHKGNLDDLGGIHRLISDFKNVRRWELHQYATISQKSLTVSDLLAVSQADFNKAIAALPKNSRLEISPKYASRKSNFKYLDFNGDLVVISNGKYKVAGNVKNLSQINEFLS